MRRAAWVLLFAAVAALAVAGLGPPVSWAVAALCVLAAGWVGLQQPRPDTAAPALAPETDVVAGLRHLVERLPEGVLLVDANETVLVANPAVGRILRRTPESMEGASLMRAVRDAALAQVLREALGEPRDVPLGDDRLVRAAGSRLAAAPVLAMLTLQDVTALRNAERARSELVANVSHELRTPITAARALAETLEAGVDEPEQRERFHARLTRELERLGEIVERLLRLSRLESRAEEFDVQPIAVTELARVAVTRTAPVALRAGVTLQVEEEIPGGGGAVLADRERALEVLTNLIDNAVRYSPSGGVVTLRLGPVGRMARICVRDQGPGVLPSERQRIFERFYTADRSRTGEAGTGLGLSIARHIVTRLGGEIWVEDVSPGATLCFTLPRAETDA